MLTGGSANEIGESRSQTVCHSEGCQQAPSDAQLERPLARESQPGKKLACFGRIVVDREQEKRDPRALPQDLDRR